MSMIRVENLTFAYSSSYDNIFDNATFQIDTNWKLGLVGRNGRGKTTLLNLLLGKYDYQGNIISSVQFDYFPYPISDKKRITEEIVNEICPLAEEWEVIRELSYLGVDAEVLWRPFETLSNGEQTKVLLAALFLNEGHFLLIDEPTNHLDLMARQKVSAYLKRKKGYILVSHDRHFLDGCVNHIMSINRSNIEVQSGNFSSWIENFKRQEEFELAQNERLQKEIGRLKQSARRAASWSSAVEKSKNGTKISGIKPDKGYVSHKAAKMMKRSKSFEARQNRAIEEKSSLLKNRETVRSLELRPLLYHSKRLASFSDVSIMYDGKVVNRPVGFEVHQGDRLVIDGKNGSGKSSLLKLLSNYPIEHTGTVTIGSGLVISYVPQDTTHLRGNLSQFARDNQVDETLFKAMLNKLGFDRVQFEKNIEDFSGGQKKKVLIAKSLCDQAHLYVWDEPLNFVDIDSRMQIEELIKAFEPTMILVEHDRAFRDKIANKVINL